MNMYRMPTAFGPSPGPRSDLAGNRFDWSEARRTAIRWVSKYDAERAQRMLPRRCELRDSALALLEFQKLENLPWLAGRGYSLFSVKLPVRFKESSGQWREMMYLLVMFENLADPIITGREELGFAKVFANLNWHFSDAEPTACEASWDGTVFFNLNLDFTKSGVSEALTAPTDMLHHRYVPAVGDWGKAAVDQFACSPAASASPISASEQWMEFGFISSPWEKLPTLSHIVSGLAELAFPRQGLARVERLTGGADYYGQRVLP